MDLQPKDILKTFQMRRIMLPIIIGLGVTAALIISNFSKPIFIKSDPGQGAYSWTDNNKDTYQDASEFTLAADGKGDYIKMTYMETIKSINWTWYSTFWLLLTILSMFIRDFFYMIRIRVLVENQLNWSSAFSVIMLWEFASAVMPALLGGGFVFAIFILNREKVNMGKSITAVMLTSFLDGIFFALVAPIVYWMAGKDNLFSAVSADTIHSLTYGKSLYYFFWLVYFCVVAYKLLIAYALFVNPRSVKRLLVKIFSLPFLKRWRYSALETGNQLIIASDELKSKHFWYWFNSFGATFITWTARYTIVNCIISAFHDVNVSNLISATHQVVPVEHFIVYARQVVMGIIMLASPTPGGSGVAELIFNNFLGEFIPAGLASTLGFVWRLVSYYPYIILGVIILPRWMRKVFAKHETEPATKI